MFYELFYPLRELFFGFNVFKYITFRAALGAVSSFLICIWLGPGVIRKLKKLGIGQNIIEQKTCPQLHSLHQEKKGTPAMGGLLILFSIISSTLLWARLDNRYILLAVFATFWLGIVGFIDDYMKFVSRRSKGITVAMKLIGQSILAVVIALFAFYDPQIGPNLELPFFKNLIINLGWFYIIFVVLVIVGSSNAVNLTDGLDGLALGCITLVALAYSIFSYITGHSQFSSYLQINYIAGSGELTVFCACIAGAALGFLWFNAHPAEVFMGDVGSLALGGAIGVVAVLIKKELLLLLAGGIFVAEALSVILQVGSFKLRGKRIFLVAPLHHHFQVRGLSETKVTVRFWIVAAILVLLTLATLKLR
ncbi:MAG: phospho-N-acetylmuramoyl-pentapeptide-transferase [Candidatus Omnitrophica bacterium]|nr:phospho-N-acetylmuramoyl-pentapeptide-transferase [Candidatus Omnitrophota bacterium]